MWGFYQLVRLRRVRKWTTESLGGRKPKFTPFDAKRLGLEHEIELEEYIASQCSQLIFVRSVRL